MVRSIPYEGNHNQENPLNVFEIVLQDSDYLGHKTSAPFKPSSNGQAERYVATLKQSLRAIQIRRFTLPELKTKIQDKLRRDNFEFRDRKPDAGDRVAVRAIRAANTRWKSGNHCKNQDGVLHYIIDVQGTLV
ncbi:transposon Tf2-6 polyprotein [Trichonephila clavipes]|nr:transposon Tf2-6 polyprotein [Trichonephila clavipes]